jgi:hypothetical protein
MKVLLLSDSDYELVKSKVSQELSCASTNWLIMRAWEKRHACKWFSRAFVRKRRIEAKRLERILSQ